MNITSFEHDNIEKSTELYNKLRENLEDFYKLALRCQRIWEKIQLVGLQHRYIKPSSINIGARSRPSSAEMIANAAKGITWRDYQVIYVPDGINNIVIRLMTEGKSKALILGPGKPESFVITDSRHNKFSIKTPVKELIIAFDLSNINNTNGTFIFPSNTEKVIIHGRVYDSQHRLTDRFAPEEANSVFSGCKTLRDLIVLDTDYSKLRDVSGLFSNCSKLRNIYLEGIDKCKYVELEKAFYTFEKCTSLPYLDLRNFRMPARGFNSTFDGCVSLKQIKTDGFTKSDMIDMRTFRYCKNLTSTGIPNFDAELKRRGAGYYYK